MSDLADRYPFLTFDLNLRTFDAELWMLLGEAASKCQHLGGVPLRPEMAGQLHEVFLARGVHATSAIEGNSLSVAEVEARLRGQLPLPPSRAYLGREIDNLIGLVNAVANEVFSGQNVANTERLRAIHRQLFEGLERPDVTPGSLRVGSVTVGRYVAPDARFVPELLASLWRWIRSPAFDLGPQRRVESAILRACVLHLYYAWIHPFFDGNGRTARLLEFALLLEGGVPTPGAHLLSNHYNRTRDEYYRRLEAARHEPRGVALFVHYALRGFVDELSLAIGKLRHEQRQDVWKSLVREAFPLVPSTAQLRQQQLAIELAALEGLLHLSTRFVNLPASIRLLYTDRTAKALSRDMNRLRELDLVVREPNGGWRAHYEAVDGLLPPRRER